MNACDEVRIAVAAIADGSLALKERIGDGWPVSQAELDAEIATQAEIGDWTVLEISEPVRRGPFELTQTDPITGRDLTFYRWQLAASVRVSLRQRD